MKMTIYFFMLVICFSIVYANIYNYNINYTSLPFNKIEANSYFQPNGTTLNIIFGNFTFGNTSYAFTSSSDSVSVITEINIPASTIVGNYSSQVLLNFSNGLNDIHTFNFNIMNDTVKEPVFVGKLGVDTFKYSLFDYMLPYNTSQSNLAITGEKNTVVYAINYDTVFFSLPNSFTLDGNGQYLLNIDIRVPNLSVGTVIKTIQFNISNNIHNLSFIFEVNRGLPPLFDLNAAIEACRNQNMSASDQLQCMIVVQQDYLDRARRAINDSAESKVVNHTVFVNRTEEKMVRVLEIDDPLTQLLLQNFPEYVDTLNDIAVNISNLKHQYEILNRDSQAQMQSLGLDLDSKLNGLRKENEELRKSVNFYEEKTIRKYWIWISASLFIFIVLFIAFLPILKQRLLILG